MLNGNLGANYNGIQISSGIFHMWRAWGITNETELMALAIGAVVMAALMLHGGIFHYHKAAPKWSGSKILSQCLIIISLV